MFSGYIEAFGLALIVGLSLGALGSGGSVLTIPVLVYVAHVPPRAAIGTSLVIVGSTSLVGAILHLRRGNVALKPAVVFALTGMASSYLGSHWTHLFPPKALMLLLAGIMITVGMMMWKGPAALGRSKSFSIGRCLAAGFFVGLLTGFLGVGGGFLIVPGLVLFAGLNTRLAAGTSLAIIALNSSTGLIGQLGYIQLDWFLVVLFLAFSIAGMVLGIRYSQRIPEFWLRRIFAALILVVGVAVGAENLR